MHGVKLLQHALTKNPEKVLDLGVGNGAHAKAFIGNGAHVMGVDVREAPHEHDNYEHMQTSIELVQPEEAVYDMVWCCHTLEHLPNPQMALIQMMSFLKDDGWLCIAVPTSGQDRLHIGHLSLWSPALLVYNLICAGWNCKDAEWYTNYQTIGLCVQKKPIEDMSWRTGMPTEESALQDYSPVPMRHESGSWWVNNWPCETIARTPDPPSVTVGILSTNLPPQVQLAYGPNPKLREGYETIAVEENRTP